MWSWSFSWSKHPISCFFPFFFASKTLSFSLLPPSALLKPSHSQPLNSGKCFLEFDCVLLSSIRRVIITNISQGSLSFEASVARFTIKLIVSINTSVTGFTTFTCFTCRNFNPYVPTPPTQNSWSADRHHFPPPHGNLRKSDYILNGINLENYPKSFIKYFWNTL